MNKKISKGMFVRIHPKICRRKIPIILSDRINYSFINRIKDSPIEVVELFYKRVSDSDFYNFLVNSNNQEMIQFRVQFNIDSILSYKNGYQYILMARLSLKNESVFQLPICFLIESFEIPLSIY